MTRYWVFTPWLPYTVDADEMVANCKFLNGQEVFAAGLSAGEFRSTPFPMAQLKMTMPGFDLDCFDWDGQTIVSEKFRLAAGLASDEIEYFDIDASETASWAQEKKYKIMSIPVNAALADVSLRFGGAPSTSAVVSAMMAGKIAVKSSVSIPFELFHDTVLRGYRFCTDEFALRLLRAGCTGMRFLDPDFIGRPRPMRYRTLRGVEEAGDWDPVAKILHSKLVESIPDAISN
ncbi:hypothetical protein RMQ97_14720 [Maricaulis sp. D1M11]|uniref:hypothetical protein n=1 Tax=Maricaulis sp. D1M11 TaxID=3076117 RepID=UPI0039B5FDA4